LTTKQKQIVRFLTLPCDKR